MLLLAYILLGVALLGTLTSTIVLVLAILGAAKFVRDGRRSRALVAGHRDGLPPVSVLKPVHGNESRIKENLESFFRQDYPAYEILFAADEADDSALPIIRELSARYPKIPCRIFITGQPLWPNAPNYCFHRLTEHATYDILVTSDSDVEVGPTYLRDVVPPLCDPKVGAVTCMFRGKRAGGVWSALDAIGQTVEFSTGVLIVNLLEGIKFGLGPTIALRKDSLAKIGGYEAVREYLSNDFVVGNFIHKAGFRVELSYHVVDHVSPVMTFRRMWERQLRWAMGTRYSRPKGHLGTGLTFAVPFGILGWIAASLLGYPYLGLSLLAASVLNRVIESVVVGWLAARDPVALWACLLYPIRDLHGFLIWCASYMSRRSLWRDNNYELLKGGRLVARRANGAVITPDFPQATGAPTSKP
ncbi:MAG: glycosyltransferase [Acidobacteria bacterium]|nr:glycosyltransferase [Acidobacteriota bacterium]MBS1865315.1 glycosyltransferase [Acidobacteriota bacterium]